jgi:hypothetical protein
MPAAKRMKTPPPRNAASLRPGSTGVPARIAGKLRRGSASTVLKRRTDTPVSAVDLGIVGLILMIVGAVMICLTLLFVFRGRQPPRTMLPPPY